MEVPVSQEFDTSLARVGDRLLPADLRRTIDPAGSKPTFGLVFERHLPERVTVSPHPVRRGLKVVRSDNGDNSAFSVGPHQCGVAVIVVEEKEIEDRYGKAGQTSQPAQALFEGLRPDDRRRFLSEMADPAANQIKEPTLHYEHRVIPMIDCKMSMKRHTCSAPDNEAPK